MSSEASKVSLIGHVMSTGKPLELTIHAEPARAKQRSATTVPEATTSCRDGSLAAAEASGRYYRENEHCYSVLHRSNAT